MSKIEMNLKGENLASYHEAVAKEFVGEITQSKEVEGVVLLGGAAKGFADQHSDIDVIVFINEKDFNKIPRGEREYRGYDLDTIVLYYPSARSGWWDMERRWAYSSAKILYDPRRKIERLLNEKIKFPKEEKRAILVEEIFFLAWYGINYKEGSWRGYDFLRKPEFWIDRGDIESAHYVLNKALDMVLDILYIANDQLIPDEKWKFHFIHSLSWLPPDFEAKLRETTLIKNMNSEDFVRRLKALEGIYRETMKKIEEETDLLPENIYQYLLDHSIYYKVY